MVRRVILPHRQARPFKHPDHWRLYGVAFGSDLVSVDRSKPVFAGWCDPANILAVAREFAYGQTTMSRVAVERAGRISAAVLAGEARAVFSLRTTKARPDACHIVIVYPIAPRRVATMRVAEDLLKAHGPAIGRN